MNPTLKSFSQRIKRFFKQRNIYIDKHNSKPFIEYAYQNYLTPPSVNTKPNAFYLTPKFIYNTLANFLHLKPMDALMLLRRHPMIMRQPPRPYQDINLSSTRLSSGKSLINMLGRKHTPTYKITAIDGGQLTPKRESWVKTNLGLFALSLSPLDQQSMSKQTARHTALSKAGQVFELDIKTDQLALWRQQSPKKSNSLLPSPHLQRPNKTKNSAKLKRRNDELQQCLNDYDADSKKGKKERFEFEVTQATILERMKLKRTISQKQVMNNCSAFQLMEALKKCAIESHSSTIHWAHRQGWALGGQQSKDNLDVTTAGSNYDTLFKVEAGLKKILLENGADIIRVKGYVKFDEINGLPQKISYRLYHHSRYFKVMIDPTSHRVPTVSEYDVASTLLAKSFA